MKLRYAITAILLIVVVWGVIHLVQRPAPPKKFIAHFLKIHLSQSQQDLIREYQAIPQDDSARLAQFVVKYRGAIRKLFPVLLNMLVAEELADSSGIALLRIEAVERLAAHFVIVNREALQLKRMRLYGSFSKAQKLRGLEAAYLLNQGDSLRSKKEYDNSLSPFAQALQLYQEIGDTLGELQSLYFIAQSEIDQKRFTKGLQTFNRCVELALQAEEPYHAVSALLRVAEIHEDLDHYDDSEAALSRALSLFERLNDSSIEARAKSLLGRVYQAKGKSIKALSVLQEALHLYGQLGDRLGKSTVFNRLGIVYRYLGNYAKAIKMLRESLNILRELNRPRLVASRLNNLGLVYSLMGENRRALEIYFEALPLYKKNAPQSAWAIPLANIGEAFAFLGKIDSARHYVNQALHYEQGPDLEAKRAETNQIFGYVLLETREWQQARDYLLPALDIHQRTGYKSGLILTHIGLGQSAFGEKKWQEAIDHFDQALEYAEASNISAYTWEILYRKGLALKEMDRINEAISFLAAAIDSIEAGRERIEQDKSKIDYLAERQEVYDEIIAASLDKEDWEISFEYLERAKARAFLDALLGGIDSDSTETPQKKEQQSSLRFLKASSVTPKSYQIRNALQAQEIIIAYRLLPDRAAIWCIGNNEIDVKQITVDRDSLRDWVRTFRKKIGADSLKAFEKRLNEAPDKAYQDAVASARQLSSILIAPVWEPIARSSTIYIVPDDILHFLPFPALTQSAASDSNRFLIEAKPLTVAPSAAVLMHTLEMNKASVEPRNMSILAVTDPMNDLPSARETSEYITKRFPNSKSLTGDQAQKNSVLSCLSRGFDVLHFGTHFEVDENNPLHSELYLASQFPSDTLTDRDVISSTDHLRMDEVFALNLSRTSLVVLSACETGLGRFARGEGVDGAARAFIYAGVPSVITTLWKIDDEATSDLMQEFYRNFNTGRYRLSQALRKAQIEKIERLKQDRVYRFPHPYLWASFVVIGNAN